MAQKLRGRQLRFIEEYKIDLNSSQAAIRAGYPVRDADKVGPRLMKNPRIKAAIQKHQKKLKDKCEVTEKQIIAELKHIAFSDIRNHLDVDADSGAVRAKGFDEMPPDSSRAIESIHEDRIIKEDACGKATILNDKFKFKLHDKLKALELLGRHLGMFKDQVAVSGKIDGPAIFMMPRPGTKSCKKT